MTTRRDKERRPAPDLVGRNVTADGPNRRCIADITHVPTAVGFLYLAVVLDAWSRKIVGWSMANHLRAERVLDALEMAVGQRRPREVIHHSDQGPNTRRWRSATATERLVCDRPWDGSATPTTTPWREASFPFLTVSCLHAELRLQVGSRMACFRYIEGWYNTVRLRSGLGCRSPIAYEHDQIQAASPEPD